MYIDAPPLLETLEELSIPENLLKYGNEEHLYHCDSGTQDENRILIFSTKVTSERLCKNGGVLLADGTFSVVPQLLVINSSCLDRFNFSGLCVCTNEKSPTEHL